MLSAVIFITYAVLLSFSFSNKTVFVYDRLIHVLSALSLLNWLQTLRAALISQMPCGHSLDIVASVTSVMLVVTESDTYM